MPPEWTPHERCLMAWPTRRDLWGGQFGAAKLSYAELAQTIARFEPVLMVANPGDGREAETLCGCDIDVIELPIDDSWLRDNGPVFVSAPDGRVAAVDFQFNAWGDKWHPYDSDQAVAALLCEQLGIPRYEAPLVMEGGSIAVDGEGTMLTTESCLLHPNRNPSMTREDIEHGLREYLGAEKVVWIPWGRSEADTDTDGHIDGVAAFAAPGVVLLQMSDPYDRNYAHFLENRRRLGSQHDAQGRVLDVRELRTVSYVEVGGRSLVLPHLNLYLANGAVIVPIAEQPTDASILEFVAAAFPDRDVVGVPSAVIAYGGGSVHCITQQQPKAQRGHEDHPRLR